MIFAKPCAGRLVRDPITKLPLAAAGDLVDETDFYWARRLRDGDIEPCAAPAEPSPQDESAS